MFNKKLSLKALSVKIHIFSLQSETVSMCNNPAIAQKINIHNDKEFTLIELMTVVGIIGILSAIAVPSLEEYRKKSKRVNAKLKLSRAYAAEKAIYSIYNNYASCLYHVLLGGGVVWYN